MPDSRLKERLRYNMGRWHTAALVILRGKRNFEKSLIWKIHRDKNKNWVVVGYERILTPKEKAQIRNYFL